MILQTLHFSFIFSLSASKVLNFSADIGQSKFSSSKIQYDVMLSYTFITVYWAFFRMTKGKAMSACQNCWDDWLASLSHIKEYKEMEMCHTQHYWGGVRGLCKVSVNVSKTFFLKPTKTKTYQTLVWLPSIWSWSFNNSLIHPETIQCHNQLIM